MLLAFAKNKTVPSLFQELLKIKKSNGFCEAPTKVGFVVDQLFNQGDWYAIILKKTRGRVKCNGVFQRKKIIKKKDLYKVADETIIILCELYANDAERSLLFSISK